MVDTNVLLVSVSAKSKTYWLFASLKRSVYKLYVTNEIISEYEEKLSWHWNRTVAEDVVRTILELPTTHAIAVFFNFDLIPHDRDDNKFVDCAVAADVDYLVTDDKDFSILKNIPFPKVNVITLSEFEQVLRNQGLL